MRSKCRCTRRLDAPPPRICETILRYDFEIVGRGRRRDRGTDGESESEREREVTVPACISPTIASSKMTSLKEESRVDIRRAPCNWKLLVNVNRFVLE